MALLTLLWQTSVLVECTVPYSAGDFLAKIHKVGTVLEEEYATSGTRIVAYLPPSLRNKLQAHAACACAPHAHAHRMRMSTACACAHCMCMCMRTACACAPHVHAHIACACAHCMCMHTA